MPGFSGYLHQLVTYEEPTFKITSLWLKKLILAFSVGYHLQEVVNLWLRKLN